MVDESNLLEDAVQDDAIRVPILQLPGGLRDVSVSGQIRVSNDSMRNELLITIRYPMSGLDAADRDTLQRLAEHAYHAPDLYRRLTDVAAERDRWAARVVELERRLAAVRELAG